MTREEKIKESWEETGIVPVLTDCVMCYMGWSRFKMSIKENPNYEFEKFHFCGMDWFRPKSLDGIDDNNGWIKMSEKEPKRGEQYWVIDELGFIEIRKYILSRGPWKDITHYKPIQEPKPPIY